MDKQERDRLRRDVWSRPDNWRGTETALYGPLRNDLFVRMDDFERLQVLASRLLDALDAAEQRAERAERRYRFLAPIIEYRREADTREMQIACALAEGVEIDKAIDDAMAIEEAEQQAERQAAKRRAGCPECRGKGWVLHPDPEARTMEPCGCTIAAADGEQTTSGGAHG